MKLGWKLGAVWCSSFYIIKTIFLWNQIVLQLNVLTFQVNPDSYVLFSPYHCISLFQLIHTLHENKVNTYHVCRVLHPVSLHCYTLWYDNRKSLLSNVLFSNFRIKMFWRFQSKTSQNIPYTVSAQLTPTSSSAWSPDGVCKPILKLQILF